MGNDHSQEEIIRCLKNWRTILKRAVAALLKGELEDLGQHIEQSLLVQNRLDTCLAGVDRRDLSNEARTLMVEIQRIQEALMSEMQKGAAVLGEKIDSLRKNTISLRGYKQPAPAARPRYLNKRT